MRSHYRSIAKQIYLLAFLYQVPVHSRMHVNPFSPRKWCSNMYSTGTRTWRIHALCVRVWGMCKNTVTVIRALALVQAMKNFECFHTWARGLGIGLETITPSLGPPCNPPTNTFQKTRSLTFETWKIYRIQRVLAHIKKYPYLDIFGNAQKNSLIFFIFTYRKNLKNDTVKELIILWSIWFSPLGFYLPGSPSNCVVLPPKPQNCKTAAKYVLYEMLHSYLQQRGGEGGSPWGAHFSIPPTILTKSYLLASP